MIAVNGKLLVGIPFGGTTYREFTLNVLTIRGELAALDALEQESGALNENPLELSDTAADLLENAAYLAEQLSVEGIPSDELTLTYLLDNLTSPDYDVLMLAQEELQVKLTAAGAAQDVKLTEPTSG